MRGYAIVNTQITDPDGYAEFIERIAGVVAKHTAGGTWSGAEGPSTGTVIGNRAAWW